MGVIDELLNKQKRRHEVGVIGDRWTCEELGRGVEFEYEQIWNYQRSDKNIY